MASPPTETSGLLEVENGGDTPRNGNRRARSRHSSRRHQYGICIFLSIVASFLIFLAARIVYSAHLPGMKWTASSQIQLLDEATEEAGNDVPIGCTSTLVLMRHCEKTGSMTTDLIGNEHCSKVGYERAKYIASLFGNNSTTEAIWPETPIKLYAMARGRPGVHHLNYREVETLQPLQKKASLDSIDARYSQGNELHLARDYFSHLASGSEYCGEITVVNWKHSGIPTMARALGCGSNEGCPSTYHKKEFDKVWQLTFEYGPKKHGKKHKSDEPQWSVHGKVIEEGFTPH